MAENKTKQTESSVEEFINTVDDEKKRNDCFKIIDLMKEVTGEEPKMWGASIVGFGSYHYKYESGREGDSCLTGFSPRKQNLTLYITAGFSEYSDILNEVGNFKKSVGCLYIKKLSDVNIEKLKELISRSVEHLKNKHA